MTLEEAIKHCEEVAKEQDKLFKQYDDASKYSRSYNKDIVSANAKKCLECFECAKEHRQLAEWLKELKRYKEQGEDCISRQAVIDSIKRYFHDEYYQRTSIQDCRDCLIKDVIKNIPPVTPQEKIRMDDIELVIKMSKEKYDDICNMYGTFCAEMKEWGLKYILNGTILPQGHGRLIDADKTISKICGSSCGCHLEECGQDMPCFSVTRIESAPTIIEADKES